jgi:centrosomal protein CEP104
VNEYDQHIAEKMCIPAKNPNIANRCPLCHTDHTPPGKIGWEVHLLQNTCPNNPRSNT